MKRVEFGEPGTGDEEPDGGETVVQHQDSVRRVRESIVGVEPGIPDAASATQSGHLHLLQPGTSQLPAPPPAVPHSTPVLPEPLPLLTHTPPPLPSPTTHSPINLNHW